MQISINARCSIILSGVVTSMIAMTALADESAVRPIRNAAEIIRVHGGSMGLTQEDIRDYIAFARAKAQDKALLPFQRADLDGDGAVNVVEAEVYSSSLSARARTWFGYDYDLADRDRDGALTPEEIAAVGIKAALKTLKDKDEAALAGLLALDANGDGAVNLDELRLGFARAGMVQEATAGDQDA